MDLCLPQIIHTRISFVVFVHLSTIECHIVNLLLSGENSTIISMCARIVNACTGVETANGSEYMIYLEVGSALISGPKQAVLSSYKDRQCE